MIPGRVRRHYWRVCDGSDEAHQLQRNASRTKRILQSTDIRLIDFGSATFEAEYHSTVVSTRHYRAPEIILGISSLYLCDHVLIVFSCRTRMVLPM
jgi:serine/threonine protein kinase